MPPDTHPRFAEPLSRGRGELVGVLAELAAVVRCLLEVVADERVVAAAVAVEPGGGALVQVGAVGFGQARVGGVAEEDVVEGVAVVAGVGSRGRVDEAGPREREQAVGDLAVGECGDGAEGELASDDRGSLEHGSLRWVEASEAASEHRFERRWQPFAAFGRERCELLDVERIPLGEPDDALARLLVEAGRKDLARMLVVQRAELNRLAERPAELRAGEAEHHERALRSLAEVVDEVEQRRLGPVHVVEDQQRRRERFEQPSHRPVRLAQRNGVFAAGEGVEPAEHELRVVLARERPLRLGAAKRTEQREQRSSLAVGGAAGDEHRGLVAGVEGDLAGKSRLPDSGLADDGDDAARVPTQRSGQPGELLIPADERGVEPPRLAHERLRALVERDAGRAGELDGAVDDGSRTADDLSRRDPGRQAELLRGRECPVRVLVAWGIGAEDRDQALGPEPLEHAAVAGERVPHRGERLVEQAAMALRIVVRRAGSRRAR